MADLQFSAFQALVQQLRTDNPRIWPEVACRLVPGLASEAGLAFFVHFPLVVQFANVVFFVDARLRTFSLEGVILSRKYAMKDREFLELLREKCKHKQFFEALHSDYFWQLDAPCTCGGKSSTCWEAQNADCVFCFLDHIRQVAVNYVMLLGHALEQREGLTARCLLALEVYKQQSRITELMIAAAFGDLHGVQEAKDLIQKKDCRDKTALMLAATNGNLEIVKALQAEAQMTDNTGKSALYFAARNGHVETAKFLLSLEKETEMAANQTTPILVAVAERCHYEIIEELSAVFHGSRDSKGRTALFHLIWSPRQPERHKEIIRHLNAYQDEWQGSGITRPMLYAFFGDRKRLVENLGELRFQDVCGHTVLHYAVQGASLNCVGLLLRMNLGKLNLTGRPAILIAYENGDAEMVRRLFLEECTADVPFEIPLQSKTLLAYARIQRLIHSVSQHCRSKGTFNPVIIAPDIDALSPQLRRAREDTHKAWHYYQVMQSIRELRQCQTRSASHVILPSITPALFEKLLSVRQMRMAFYRSLKRSLSML